MGDVLMTITFMQDKKGCWWHQFGDEISREQVGFFSLEEAAAEAAKDDRVKDIYGQLEEQ